MEEKDKNLVQETSENATLNEQMEEEREFLSDKAKIMSPGRLVAKRFFRSRLSVVGLVILIALYVLSFVGPWFTGYHYSEIMPFVGSAVASVWCVAVSFAGCKYALGLSWGKTALALAPLFILGVAVLVQMSLLMRSML